jgi:hypothetical protein
MSRWRFTSANNQAVRDDFAATFPYDYQTKAVDAMNTLLKNGLRGAEWMEKDQIKIALRNVERWYEKQPMDEREHFARSYRYLCRTFRKRRIVCHEIRRHCEPDKS